MKSYYSILYFCFYFWLIFSPSAKASEKGMYVYVSLDSSQTIAVYKVDPINGDLTFVNETAVDGQPVSLAVDPTNRFLHAAQRTKNSVASFRIDEKSGELTLIGTVNVSWNPVYLSMDRTGKFLFTTHFSDNKAAVYAVGQNGAVQSGALQVLTTASNPHSILIDKSNRYLFIPCRSGEAILQYRFNETNGSISLQSPDRWTARDSIGPRHIIMHPFLKTVYVVNEFGRSVTAFQLDDEKGTLTEIQTLSMQPENKGKTTIARNTGGADIHCTPDGRFLYATNRGPDSIASYQLNPTTGSMTIISQYPTEKMPRSFGIDQTGKFLYAGGQLSGTIASYFIEPANGKLRPLKIYSVGRNPVWILMTKKEILK